jgi:hypothetical protein
MGANAVTTVPVYTAGEVLTAADLNITNSGIPVFAGTSERDAAFGGTGEKTLAEGQFAYLETGNVTQYYDGAAWQPVAAGVFQVKSTTKTDTFSMSSLTFADVTGLSVTITPTSATNKVLVMVDMMTGNNTNAQLFARLLRDSTDIVLGDTAGSRTRVTSGIYESNGNTPKAVSFSFLDSPATTSATTYKVQIASSDTTAVTVNRTEGDADTAARPRGVSTITVFEVTP